MSQSSLPLWGSTHLPMAQDLMSSPRAISSCPSDTTALPSPAMGHAEPGPLLDPHPSLSSACPCPHGGARCLGLGVGVSWCPGCPVPWLGQWNRPWLPRQPWLPCPARPWRKSPELWAPLMLVVPSNTKSAEAPPAPFALSMKVWNFREEQGQSYFLFLCWKQDL